MITLISLITSITLISLFHFSANAHTQANTGNPPQHSDMAAIKQMHTPRISAHYFSERGARSFYTFRSLFHFHHTIHTYGRTQTTRHRIKLLIRSHTRTNTFDTPQRTFTHCPHALSLVHFSFTFSLFHFFTFRSLFHFHHTIHTYGRTQAGDQT
jgi:hypothetical protein